MENNPRNKAITISLGIIFLIWSVNGMYMSFLSGYSKTLFWSLDLVQWVVIPSAIIIYLSSKNQLTIDQYGLDFRQLTIKTLIWTVPATLTLYPSFFWVTDFTRELLGQPSGFFTFHDAYPDGIMGTIVWLYSALTAGIVESIFFIGLPWLLWSRRVKDNTLAFIVIISVIFAAVHWEQGLHILAGAFVFSLAACTWYLSLKTLWPVLLAHIFIDLIAL